ncbi:MAG: ComF family protein [Chitinophagaceae bacterium]
MLLQKSIHFTISHLSHLFYPHVCEGCGTDILQANSTLCSKCIYNLPVTGFTNVTGNFAEKKFIGRMSIEKATSALYFNKKALVQHLIFQLKYRNNQAIGLFLGKILGEQLLATNRFNDIDLLIPIPLNAQKEKKRGYNQAAVICKGITSVWPKPIDEYSVIRSVFTETQTKQNRISRWQNIDGAFSIANADALKGKHIALVDDVLTTGATFEACGNEILQVNQTKLSILSVAYTV